MTTWYYLAVSCSLERRSSLGSERFKAVYCWRKALKAALSMQVRPAYMSSCIVV